MIGAIVKDEWVLRKQQQHQPIFESKCKICRLIPSFLAAFFNHVSQWTKFRTDFVKLLHFFLSFVKLTVDTCYFLLYFFLSVFLSRTCTTHLFLAIHIYIEWKVRIVSFVVKSRKFQVGILCDDCHAIQTNSYFRNVPTKFEQFQKRIHFTVDRSCTYFVSFQCIQRMFAMQRKHRK